MNHTVSWGDPVWEDGMVAPARVARVGIAKGVIPRAVQYGSRKYLGGREVPVQVQGQPFLEQIRILQGQALPGQDAPEDPWSPAQP